jgi:hypothetical protein
MYLSRFLRANQHKKGIPLLLAFETFVKLFATFIHSEMFYQVL